MAGKLGRQGCVSAITPGRLLHLVDELSGIRFLVDSGASFSIIPHHSSLPGSGPRLRGPSGSSISCWGDTQLCIKVSGHQFSWCFLKAAVAFPIIGIDFLKNFKLQVDPAGERLVCGESGFTNSLFHGVAGVLISVSSNPGPSCPEVTGHVSPVTIPQTAVNRT